MLSALVALSFAAVEPMPDDAAIVARLVEALRDPDLEVRQSLGSALARLPGAAVGPLRDALLNPNAARRAGAAYALGLLGGRAESALPQLLDAVTDADLEVRRQAAQAVGRVLAGRTRPQKSPVVRGDR